jgi:hypothetical protein
MDIYTKSVCAILEKLACVDIAIGVVKSTLALSHAVPPVSIVLGAVLPQLLSFAVLDVNLILGFSIEN